LRSSFPLAFRWLVRILRRKLAAVKAKEGGHFCAEGVGHFYRYKRHVGNVVVVRAGPALLFASSAKLAKPLFTRGPKAEKDPINQTLLFRLASGILFAA